MDNMKNGVHADTAEAENTETMDLLAGMLDASTQGKNRQFYSTSKVCGQSAHLPYPAYWAEAGRRRIQANNTTNIIPH